MQCIIIQVDNCVVLLLMQSFKEMFTGIKSKFEALEVANTQLREAVHLPNLQVFCLT